MRLNLAIGFALVLVAFILLSVAPLPAAHDGRAPVSALALGADRPVAEICLPDAEIDACAALFLDEDGYELCLRDGASGRVKCLNEFRDADRETGPPTDSLPALRTVAL